LSSTSPDKTGIKPTGKNYSLGARVNILVWVRLPNLGGIG